ncbi:uncharacterized protein LOC110853225 [Folsomia candida]|uniref:General odorant-binding protein 19d n=1 Tax=Folsomia candida TaxID=158441 RepID=A0A226E1T7_FOLCA|nr:uncharacterized protein LOC110853225 [Folsomia candida]OXA51248.1 General odorant-binding protein 19d [Folsomia candida]
MFASTKFSLLQILLVILSISITRTNGVKLGKLDCSENDGLKPDSDLLNLIVSKCQPKQGQPEKMIAACLMKCLMKQQKAVDKKGKLKHDKALGVVEIFPEKFKTNITAKFEQCCTDNNDKLKKEPNGCESWLPFSECFYDFAKSLCPSEKERKRLASTTPSSDTTTH